MQYLGKYSFLCLATSLLAGCGMFATSPSSPKTSPVPSYDRVAAIRAAGDREQSIIDVNPLRDPGVTLLQDAAKHDEQTGKYPDAAGKLDTRSEERRVGQECVSTGVFRRLPDH